MWQAGLGARTALHANLVTKITHIHTHLNIAHPTIAAIINIPSDGDFNYLNSLRANWKLSFDRDISIQGIVLPNLPNCPDVMYVIDPDGLSPATNL